MGRAYVRDDDGELPRGFITFAGQQINLHQMAVEENFDYSYLWRVFKGGRMPSVYYAKRIAKCLHLSMDELVAALNT